MKRIILIDFENTQQIDFDLVDTTDTGIMIFVGRSQSRIPFDLVEKAQTLGERLRWLKISGDGKNNLDFHIAFELGRLCAGADRGAELIVLSRDNGYDSLIDYIKSTGVQARRIANLAEVPGGQQRLPSSPHTAAIVANLRKIGVPQRPRSRGTLRKHIESLLRDKATEEDLDLVVEEMFIAGLIAQSGSRLKYNL
jgi:hypothetical protein